MYIEKAVGGAGSQGILGLNSTPRSKKLWLPSESRVKNIVN
jgi:hypothetical protein